MLSDSIISNIYEILNYVLLFLSTSLTVHNVKNTINLLSFKEGPLTFWEKFYIWALSIGRYIIIITELIVLIGFFLKFKVDNDIANIKTDLNANVEVLKENQAKENEIKIYQKRISTQEAIMNNQSPIYSLLTHTISLIPPTVKVDSLNFHNKGQILIQGSITGTGNVQLNTLQNLADTYRGDKAYVNVAETNVSTNSQENLTNFSITMNVNTLGQ